MLVQESAAGEVQRAGGGGTAMAPIPVSGVCGLPPLHRAMPCSQGRGLPDKCGCAPLKGWESCCEGSRQRPPLGLWQAPPASLLDTQLPPREQMFPIHTQPRCFQQLWMEREGSWGGRLSAKMQQRGEDENPCSKATEMWAFTKGKQIPHLIPKQQTPSICPLITNKISQRIDILILFFLKKGVLCKTLARLWIWSFTLACSKPLLQQANTHLCACPHTWLSCSSHLLHPRRWLMPAEQACE